MKKKLARKAVHKAAPVKRVSRTNNDETYLVVFKSWMFVVAFAIMMGVGVILGTFARGQVEQANNGRPTVAGAQYSQ